MNDKIPWKFAFVGFGKYVQKNWKFLCVNKVALKLILRVLVKKLYCDMGNNLEHILLVFLQIATDTRYHEATRILQKK